MRGKEDYELVLLAQPKAAEKLPASAPVDTQARVGLPGDTAAVGKGEPGRAVAEVQTDEVAERPVVYDPAGDFTVQIGTYEEARQAGERVKKLSAEGYPAYALANTGNKGARVRIGYFKTREDAERFGRVFKKDKGVDFWVDRRANEKL